MFRHRIALVAFTPITTSLFKTTLAMMDKRGHPMSLHEGDDPPDLYLIDTDNEDACESWRSTHTILKAPILLIGRKNYDFEDSIHLGKPLKWDILLQAILESFIKRPPKATPRWLTGYKESTLPFVNPLQGLLRPRALVVDDSSTIRHYLGLKLSNFGFDIDQAETAEEAFLILKEKSYICIFMDVMMPGMNGYDACKLLRKEMLITVPIVMVTSRDSPFDKMRGQIAGATDYLVKPIDDTSFNMTMRRVLQRNSAL